MDKCFYEKLIRFAFSEIDPVLCEEFSSAINRDNRLASFDGDIYSSYERVTGYFEKTRDIYDKNIQNVHSKEVRTLLSGLMAVVRSRLAVKAETMSRYGYDDRVDGIDPIKTEKEKICAELKKEWEEVLSKIIEKNSENACLYSDTDITLENICNMLQNMVCKDMKGYADFLINKYIALMNDIEKREIVHTFYELLKEEGQVLGGIIKVQANELEHTNRTENEEEMIQKLLYDLREAYQYVTRDIDKIREKFGTVENRGKQLYLCPDDIFTIDKGKVEKFLSENVDVYVSESKGILKEAKSITDKVISAFSNMIKAEKNIVGADKQIVAIAEGIDETLKIKKEVLEESFEIFEENFKSDMPRNAAEKKYTAYLRQSLLFELTTFEEILNYSVSRLRGCAAVKSYVNTIDKEVKNIEIFLKDKGIETIEPKPHDIFCAKTHDVLMAEKSEGFKKGEIIKVMTKGYKKGSAVYIRASVIAAK